MKMEGVERSELRKLQKEQERERRRLRDRQRRQSMSVEEREKHLARRRRNYQLRRLRAGIGIAPSQSEHEHEHDQEQEQEQEPTSSTDQLLALPSSDPSTAQCNNDVLAIESHQAVTNSTNSEKVPVHKLAQFSGQLRLNRVKSLARSLNGHVGDNHVMIKANEVSSDIMAKGLRLNRVKNLARSLNSAVKESSNQNHPRQIEGLKDEPLSCSNLVCDIRG
ncbi:glutamic acid-rich protein isoform X2 [Pistacia vera]|uniref:glutamic acid-rich protein isoform X2 n=1 Tax=Pistacia vera TaxID=55513 RepID=UPI00126333B3|nr:glutamic acid-rich protein isoform X2 [Pistacia vera]